MGIGVGLALIAVGAVLAFAVEFELAGIDLQTIGWILIAVGLVGLAFTFLFVRPRRARRLTEMVDEPVHVRPDDADEVATRRVPRPPAPPAP